MAILEREDFWGGKLSKSSPVVKFHPEFKYIESGVDYKVDHKLVLSQACLGSKASGRSIVEVTAEDDEGNECTHTIVSLREGSTEMCTLNLNFNSPATFKLIEGSGPVHLTGSHIQSIDEEEEEESDEESDKEAPNLVEMKNKPQKRPVPASTLKGPTPNKVAKVEEEESDEEESDEEEEEDESDEEKKEVSKKPDDKKKESKKPSNVLEAEEDEESEEESEEESDEDEEDESDEEEEDESDEEEESDDEEEEDEVTATLTAKKKQADKKPLTNGVGPKKAGKEEKTPQGKPPQQKTPQTKTPQTKTPQTKTPQTKTPQPTKDIGSIKKALLKSPALPKKMEKFQNVMRSSYKITDKDTVKDLWDYVQKNKK